MKNIFILVLITSSMLLISCKESYNRKLKGDIIVHSDVQGKDYYGEINMSFLIDTIKKFTGYRIIGSYNRELTDTSRNSYHRMMGEYNLIIHDSIVGTYDSLFNHDHINFNKLILKNSKHNFSDIIFKTSSDSGTINKLGVPGPDPNVLFFKIDTIKLYYSNSTYTYIQNESTKCGSFDYSNGFNTSYIIQTKQTTKNMTPLITVLIIFVISMFLIYVHLKIQDNLNTKEQDKKDKFEEELRSLYQLSKKPLLVSSTQLSSSQNQTRQMLTGALTYAQQKEYELSIFCINISDKVIKAAEFEVQTLNAFNEVISSFTVSTRDYIIFGRKQQCNWNINGPFDVKNTITKVKRVMFEDETTWIEK